MSSVRPWRGHSGGTRRPSRWRTGSCSPDCSGTCAGSSGTRRRTWHPTPGWKSPGTSGGSGGRGGVPRLDRDHRTAPRARPPAKAEGTAPGDRARERRPGTARHPQHQRPGAGDPLHGARPGTGRAAAPRPGRGRTAAGRRRPRRPRRRPRPGQTHGRGPHRRPPWPEAPRAAARSRGGARDVTPNGHWTPGDSAGAPGSGRPGTGGADRGASSRRSRGPEWAFHAVVHVLATLVGDGAHRPGPVHRGDGRGRHPPQERPRPSRGTGRAATRTLYSAAAAFSVTPRCVTS